MEISGNDPNAVPSMEIPWPFPLYPNMEISGNDPNAVPSMGIPVPVISAPPLRSIQPWNTAICGCFPDYFGRFCISFWFPCYTFGQVSEIVDRGSSSCALNGAIYFLLVAVTGCACYYSMVYRMKMRRQYRLEGSDCEDVIFHCLCEPCALTQEYIELQNRGFDLSQGWVERHDRGVVKAPVVESGMTR